MNKEKETEKKGNFLTTTNRFLTEVWNEVDFRPGKGRVSWPTWESVKASTHVVIASSIGLGIFIGALDFFLAKLLNLIIQSGNSPIGLG